MKLLLILAVGLASLIASAGCVPPYYGQYERERVSEVDTLQVPAMTTEDVIALAREGISDEVIVSQIKATGSYFQLSTDDILELKKAGVSEKVMSAMIKSGESRPVRRAIRRYYYGYPPYVPYSIYYGYPWYNPWYSSIHLGFSYRNYYPYVHSGFNSGHFSGGHYSGFHGYGGHRSFGGHR